MSNLDQTVKVGNTATINISTGKPNPIQKIFPTTIWQGYLDIDHEKLINLAEWARLQNWEDLGDTYSYTTRNGSQFITPKPIWEYPLAPAIKELMPQIQTALDEWVCAMTEQSCFKATPKGSQFVLYNPGGHQWPHWHDSTWTAILGLRNRGTLLLQDPRPLAITQGFPLIREIIINPGQLLITPGYLVHSSAASNKERDILVFMGD
jgi:hypothetical protein